MNYRSINRTAKATTAAVLIFAVRGVLADNSISYSGGNYTQDFNSLATYSSATTFWTNNTTPPENIEPGIVPIQIGSAVGVPIDLTGPSQDVFTSIPAISTMTGWSAINFGGNSLPLTYNVNNGSSNTPALTAFFDPGNQAVGTPNNMSLGAVTSSATGNVVFGAKFVNTGTVTLNAISLSYTGELFHQDTSTKTLSFGYLVTNATNNIDILVPSATSSSTIGYGALNVGGFTTGAAGTANSTQAFSVVNLPLTSNWAPGQALWITWQMGVGGGGQGLGIDDLTFSASHLAALPTLTWTHIGDGAWDTVSNNWSGAGTTFANGSNALFGNIAGNVLVSVDGAGVTVSASVTINNSANTYTFSGGPIGGASAALIVAGSGTVRLTSPNSYGFATNLNSGTLIIDNNNELGASTAALVLNGGTLKAAANLDAGTRQLNVNTAGGTINLNGFGATLGLTSASVPVLHGELDVTGGGNLNLGIQPTIGSNGGPGHLKIDAGSTVTLLGNGRSSATDMWDGGIINGVLVLDSGNSIAGARFNFDSAGTFSIDAGGTAHNTGSNGTSIVSGTGQIQVPWGSQWVVSGSKGQLSDNSTTTNNIRAGVIISNTSGANGANISANILLNSQEGTPGHSPFVRTDVTSPHAFDGMNSTAADNNTSNPHQFITIIGGTKNNGSTGKGGIGALFSTVIFSGVISGDSDISVGNDYKSGGSGNVLLTNHNTYHGVTMLNGGGNGTPVLYIGIDNALPTDTDLVFGSLNGAGAPSLDLNGHNQTIESLCVGQVTNAPQLNQINNSGTTPGTLTISGSVTPFTSYNGQINDTGPVATNALGTSFTQFAGSTTAIVKDGSSTLVLGQYLSAGHTTISTYSGGTTVKGGTLQIPFDGAMGAATGALTFDGGTVSVQTPDLQYDLEQTVTWTSARPITVTANGGTILTPTFNVTGTSGAFSGTHTLVAAVAFTGAGGYNWDGPLHLSGASGSLMTLSGSTGAVSVNPAASITVDPTVSLTIAGTTDPLTDSVNSSNHVALQVGGSLTFNGPASYAATTIAGAGSVQVAAGTTLNSKSLNGNALTVNGIHNIVNSSGVSKLASLSVPGKLNVNNNDLIVASGSNVPGLIVQAADHGAWDINTGITSTTVIASLPSLTKLALGYATGLEYRTALAVQRTTFDSVPIVDSNVLVKTTLAGDANMDGSVNLLDFQNLQSNFNSSSKDWMQGDFNYDGQVNLLDFQILQSNFNKSLPPGGPAGGGGVLGGGSGLGSTSVPEPGTLAAILLGIPFLLRRKRSHN